jgi:hypothetical protein
VGIMVFRSKMFGRKKIGGAVKIVAVLNEPNIEERSESESEGSCDKGDEEIQKCPERPKKGRPQKEREFLSMESWPGRNGNVEKVATGARLFKKRKNAHSNSSPRCQRSRFVSAESIRYVSVAVERTVAGDEALVNANYAPSLDHIALVKTAVEKVMNTVKGQPALAAGKAFI